MSEPARRVSTRPAGRGGAREWREPALRQGGVLVTFSSPQESRHCRGETRPITANRRHPKPNGKDRSPDRSCAGRRIVSEAALNSGIARPPAMAKPSRRCFPFCSAEEMAGDHRAREDVEPRRALSTRPADAERHREPVLRRGFCDFHATRNHRLPGRDPANHRHRSSTPQTAKSKPSTGPACAGATNRARMPCPKRRQPAGNGEAEPAVAFPLRRRPKANPRTEQQGIKSLTPASPGRRSCPNAVP